ncbi:hypothetical protein ACFXO8_35465, partial [Nocardia tengchongensis]
RRAATPPAPPRPRGPRGARRAPAPRGPRGGLRSNGSAFTIDSMARYFLHDLVHHVHDVERG